MAKKKKRRAPVQKRAAKKKPAKAKKRPAKRPAKKAAKKKVRVELEIPESVTANAAKNIRWFAGQFYAVNSCSIAEMSGHPQFKDIPQKTLESWSLADHWVAERQRFQEKVKARVQNVLVNEITRERSTQLKKVVEKRDAMSDFIMGKIEKMVEDDDAPEEKLTSLVNTWVRLADLADGFMDKLGEVIIPAAFPEENEGLRSTAQLVKPQLTPEEARAAARLLIKMRREETRRLRDGGAAPEVEEAAPNLRVLGGK